MEYLEEKERHFHEKLDQYYLPFKYEKLLYLFDNFFFLIVKNI